MAFLIPTNFARILSAQRIHFAPRSFSFFRSGILVSTPTDSQKWRRQILRTRHRSRLSPLWTLYLLFYNFFIAVASLPAGYPFYCNRFPSGAFNLPVLITGTSTCCQLRVFACFRYSTTSPSSTKLSLSLSLSIAIFLNSTSVATRWINLLNLQRKY